MMSATPPRICALLIDLSGTLHVGSSPTLGAVEAITQLHRTTSSNTLKHIPFRFCSNTSKEGRNELQERLRAMGFELQSGDGRAGKGREMWTSLGAVSGLLGKRGLKRPYCLLEPSSKDEVLRDLGRSASTSDDTGYDSVVVGLAPSHFSYDHLNAAFRILLSSPPKPLIATHRAKYIRVAQSPVNSSTGSTSNPHETLSLGPGPFVAALETATGVQAEVVGKPSRAFFETVIDSFNEDELGPLEDGARIAIIGDDVETDLGGGALELGLWRVLVKTGKYRPGDENKPGVVPPDEVHESFAEFVSSLLKRA